MCLSRDAFRVIGLVPIRIGRKAVALPCPATNVSCVCGFFEQCADVDALLVVDQNPELFADAYWEINSLRVYTPVTKN
jgi:hypothetical protein